MDDDELSQHLIYHQHHPPTSSSAYDIPIPDYLPLRRVKPLPKRKRSSPDPARSLPPNTLLPPILPPPPGPDATAEELIAHAEVLSAQITLHSYFLPTLNGGGATDFTRRNSASSCSSSNGSGGGGGVEVPRPPVADVTANVDVTPAPCESREGDHLDQSQHQGNAKKRKVPAHLSGSQMGSDSADVRSGDEEELLMLSGGERVPSSLACPAGAVAGGGAFPKEEAFNGGAEADGCQGKVLPATMVGLRQKQVLKHRRRQLAALLSSGSGSPSLGDSLALEQALLANNYALLNDNRSGLGRNVRLKSRLIRRRASRAAVRRHCTLAPPPPPSEGTCRIFPDSEFTFLSSNAASERLIATRAEYAVLCNRFEHELARQAENVAEGAKKSIVTAGTNTIGGGGATATAATRNERAVRKARATTQSVVQQQQQQQDAADMPAVSKSSSSSTKTSGKKKKRSALANASNPHHLRNYVPSRIPNQGQLSAAQLGASAQNMLGPLALVFLSAQIPPKRGTQPRPSAMASQLTNPAEEWICPACEYRLFYGDEQGYRMGVRNRKKILKRRRRARERAAAAANGSGTGVGIHGKGSGFDDEEDLDIETTGSGLALGQTRLANVEREKGGGDRERLVELGAAG